MTDGFFVAPEEEVVVVLVVLAAGLGCWSMAMGSLADPVDGGGRFRFFCLAGSGGSFFFIKAAARAFCCFSKLELIGGLWGEEDGRDCERGSVRGKAREVGGEGVLNEMERGSS